MTDRSGFEREHVDLDDRDDLRDDSHAPWGEIAWDLETGEEYVRLRDDSSPSTSQKNELRDRFGNEP